MTDVAPTDGGLPPRFTSKRFVHGMAAMLVGGAIVIWAFVVIGDPFSLGPGGTGGGTGTWGQRALVCGLGMLGAAAAVAGAFFAIWGMSPPKWRLTDGTLCCTTCGYPQASPASGGDSSGPSGRGTPRCTECGSAPRRQPPVTLRSILVDIVHVTLVFGAMGIFSFSIFAAGVFLLVLIGA